MNNGKASWQCFAAACKFFPLLRTLNPGACVVTHYCFDGALQSALSTKMHQRHLLYYGTIGGPIPRTGETAMAELLDW
eukprot:5747606-Lingulodinium_polyedra.AAC.1